jgi:hypothetical protein
LHEEHPHPLPVCYTFGDARANHRAVEWLAENSLIDDHSASRVLTVDPDPELP